MRACKMRAAFARSERKRPSIPSGPQLLGTICHDVLQALARSRAILSPGWERQLETEWSTATRAAAAHLAQDHGERVLSPEQWDGYQIKLARLRKAARRLHDLLAPLGSTAELITERPLSAADGRVHGRPDLVVRTPTACWIIDYKTGAVLTRETREPHESYVRQLQLYAFLAAETIGRWPERAFLVPLQGAVVEVPIDPTRCSALAEEAIALLDAFNDRVPAPQPPSPAPETCQRCPYAPRCPAFWQACDEAWASVVLAAAGTVTSLSQSRLGGVSLTLDAEVGSLGERHIAVRGISVQDHPAAGSLASGGTVALVGLHADRGTDSFILPPFGRAWSLA